MSIEAMKSEPIERGKEMSRQIRKRNPSTWNELDREVVFAINALVSFAEFLYARQAIAEAEQDGQCKHCTNGCVACDARFAEAEKQRQWVGLDNDDLIYIYSHADKSVGRAIELTEAKLKEKNT